MRVCIGKLKLKYHRIVNNHFDMAASFISVDFFVSRLLRPEGERVFLLDLRFGRPIPPDITNLKVEIVD